MKWFIVLVLALVLTGRGFAEEFYYFSPDQFSYVATAYGWVVMANHYDEIVYILKNLAALNYLAEDNDKAAARMLYPKQQNKSIAFVADVTESDASGLTTRNSKKIQIQIESMWDHCLAHELLHAGFPEFSEKKIYSIHDATMYALLTYQNAPLTFKWVRVGE